MTAKLEMNAEQVKNYDLVHCHLVLQLGADDDVDDDSNIEDTCDRASEAGAARGT